MGGLFYHFVIGNGSASPDGKVEVGWRWRKQSQVNRPYEIQICLVGDFNRQQVSSAQYESLLELIALLSRQYKIARKYIRRHKEVSAKATDCPGSNFPFSRLIAELKNAGY
jgi:N-acetyl-anhydromuramyl-L-alanine amidase AmpD